MVMKSYEVTACKIKDCQAEVTTLIFRSFDDKNRNMKKDVFFGYCKFHAILAEGFFGNNSFRHEVKGIRP